MKKKIGTSLDIRLFQRLKLEAAREGAPLNELLEKALWSYLEIGKENKSFTDSTKGVLKASKKNVKEILEEDLYDA